MLDGIVSKNVVSNLTDEKYISTKPLGRYSLVGSLSSGADDEIISQHCFTGTRHFVGKCCHVSVGTAYYQDSLVRVHSAINLSECYLVQPKLHTGLV